MAIWPKPHPVAGNDHLSVSNLDTSLDEWAAMREVYEALRHFDERAQTRIVEAVRNRLGDELAAARHAEREQRLDTEALEAI